MARGFGAVSIRVNPTSATTVHRLRLAGSIGYFVLYRRVAHVEWRAATFNLQVMCANDAGRAFLLDGVDRPTSTPSFFGAHSVTFRMDAGRPGASIHSGSTGPCSNVKCAIRTPIGAEPLQPSLRAFECKPSSCNSDPFNTSSHYASRRAGVDTHRNALGRCIGDFFLQFDHDAGHRDCAVAPSSAIGFLSVSATTVGHGIGHVLHYQVIR